ncbi:hypothetical protein CPC197_0287A, partial [Chlamydia psittaci C1/97]
MVKNISCL